MASGEDKADWTVDLQPFGQSGAVRCGTLRGVFGGITIGNTLHITWKTAWPAGADVTKLKAAAEQAVRDALKGRG